MAGRFMSLDLSIEMFMRPLPGKFRQVEMYIYLLKVAKNIPKVQ